MIDSSFGKESSPQVFSMTSQEMQEKSKAGDLSVFEIMHAPEFKTLTDLNLRQGIGKTTEALAVLPAGTVVTTGVVVTESVVNNVGANEKGLWLMVRFQNQSGFVRGSLEYILPVHQH